MRRIAFILAMHGCGCMEAVTAEEELELLEAEADYGGLQVVPDTAEDLDVGPPPRPRGLARGPVRIEVSRYRIDEDPLWADGAARCPFDIRAVGLPAIRKDGGAIADLRSGYSATSEGEDEVVSFRVFDVETEDISEYKTLVEGEGQRGRYDRLALAQEGESPGG